MLRKTLSYYYTSEKYGDSYLIAFLDFPGATDAENKEEIPLRAKALLEHIISDLIYSGEVIPLPKKGSGTCITLFPGIDK